MSDAKKKGHYVQAYDIVITPDGHIVHVYSDELASLFRGENVATHRASHVEPDGDGWTADMAPSGSNVKLGPFQLRQEALDAETEWLERHMRGETCYRRKRRQQHERPIGSGRSGASGEATVFLRDRLRGWPRCAATKTLTGCKLERTLVESWIVEI